MTLVRDLFECLEGILLNTTIANDEKRKLLSKKNRIDQALFDLPERINKVMEGVEENFCGI